MVYPENFEAKIGFDVVRKMLKEACLCPQGEERVDAMAFTAQFEQIHTALLQTEEFVRVLREEEFPDQHFFDVRPALRRIKIPNTYLLVEELFDLQRSLDSIDQIVKFFARRTEGDEQAVYPQLVALSQNIKTYPNLNHLFQHCETGLAREYGEIEETFSEEVLKDIADWINRVTIEKQEQ